MTIENHDLVEVSSRAEWRRWLDANQHKSRSIWSAWSAINKSRVEKLIAAGLMQPAGLNVVQAAKASGKWDALHEVEALTVPHDLANELKQLPQATTHFDAFPKSVKRGILEWISSAKNLRLV